MIQYIKIIIFIYLFIVSIYYLYNYYTINTKNLSIPNYKINQTLFEVASNSHDFVFNAHFGFLNQVIPNKIKRYPDISVVIPIYNSENFIRRAILSIQNQNFKNFEIIIINDHSTDNSFKIINKLSYFDKRIKVINNTKHMGQFYSRFIGSIASKGKYIFPLDSDDMYLINDTFDEVHIELEKNKPDILLFNGIKSLNFNNFFKNENISLFREYINNNKLLYQPEIAKSSYKKCSLQATSISKNLYSKIFNFYGKFHLYDNITYLEDCIINHIMHQYANSCEHFNKIGYLHIYRASSHSHTETAVIKLKSNIYYIDVLYEYSTFSNRTKMLSIQKFCDFINDKNFKFLFKDSKNLKLVKSLINKFKNDKYINICIKDNIFFNNSIGYI